MWGATHVRPAGLPHRFPRLRYEGRYTPPSLRAALVYPGNFGVFNWGGMAVDPVRAGRLRHADLLAFTSQADPAPADDAAAQQGSTRAAAALNENFGAPYAASMGPFLSPLGMPCQAPPWGYVAGVDLAAGKIAWRHRNGTVRDLSPVPLPFKMGVPGLGGPMVTAGGVAFLTARSTITCAPTT